MVNERSKCMSDIVKILKILEGPKQSGNDIGEHHVDGSQRWGCQR